MSEDLNLTEQQVRSAQSGDGDALNDLFRRYLPRVRRIVANRLGRLVAELADVEDLVQETFLDALRGIERFSYRTEGSFLDWLARAVENNVRDAVRHGQRHKRGGGRVRRFADLGRSSLGESIFAGSGPTPSQHLRAEEAEERIERALLELGDRHREVINLRVHCGMSFREIAQALSLRSENTANVLFLRARKELARRLEGV